MTRHEDKKKAINLRSGGLSYSQITEKLGIKKGTLSGWLNSYPLPPDKLKIINERRMINYRETRRKRREEKYRKIYLIEKENILPLSKRDLFIAGLFLYWGEGGKTKINDISVSNTDPAVLKFFIHWAVRYMDFPKEKIRATIHLYKDMDVNKEINFWSKTLGFSRNQITKPYIKNTSLKSLSYKSGFRHGTCNVRIGSAKIAGQVHMGLKVLQDKFN